MAVLKSCISLKCIILQVVGVARREERLQALACDLQNQQGKFHIYTADISKEDEIITAVKWITQHIGPINILVNNAGVTFPTSLHDGDSTIWRKILDTNVFGLCVATREAIRDMKKNGVNGHIIHINSINGHQVSVLPQSNVYSASKFAVTALTETLRKELVGLGSKIKVTVSITSLFFLHVSQIISFRVSVLGVLILKFLSWQVRNSYWRI